MNLQNHIDALRRKAETGEQWAAICALEADMVERNCDCEDVEHETSCRKHPDYDPTPYCSYGHMTKAQCDCGPIAENE